MRFLRTLLLAGRHPVTTPQACHVIPQHERLFLRKGRFTKVWITELKQMSSLFAAAPLMTPAWNAQRSFHCTTYVVSYKVTPSADKKQDNGSSSLVTYEDLFEKASRVSKSKATFNQVLDVFCKRDIRRRGHVEFIYAALKKMPEFGVERDLSVYNKLLDVFPKEVFVARNFIQRMFNHYPRQQECAVEVLEQMETYGILPNKDTKFLLLQIFGDKSHPIRKYQRIMYWFPRFKHINPYLLPVPLPQDPIDLAKLALQRISADLDARTTVYQMPSSSEEIDEYEDDKKLPYIIGIQSPDQRSLLAQHNPDRPVVVEGPFTLWLKATRVFYYVLRADPLPPEEKREVLDPERNFYYPMFLDLQLERDLGDDDDFDIDDVDEGPVFAMCMAGSGDRATLARWISGLQENNPNLCRTTVMFQLESEPWNIQLVSEPGQHRDGDIDELQSQKVTQ